MTLPPLPTKRNNKEAKITPLVLRYFERCYPHSVALEIKCGKNKLLPHQRAALLQVQKGVFSHKMADMGRVNPFDAFVLKNAVALVVVCVGRLCTAYTPTMERQFEFKV